MPTVTINLATFNVHVNPRGEPIGSRWNGRITAAFQTAATIFSSRAFGTQPIRLLQGYRADLSVAASRHFLSQDIWAWSAGATNPTMFFRQRMRSQHRQGVLRYQRLAARGTHQPHHLNAEYFVNVASTAPSGSGNGVLHPEGQNILRLNQRGGQIAAYWVPGFYNPPTALATTVSRAFYGNAGLYEGIFMGPNAGSDTLAHELVHLLGQFGHCSSPAAHTVGCTCAPTNNLMYPDGGTSRVGTDLTNERVVRIRERGRSYLH